MAKVKGIKKPGNPGFFLSVYPFIIFRKCAVAIFIYGNLAIGVVF
jgi:hypothetical protein